MKRFQLAVFGKQGCDKCDVLKKRLQKLLEDKAYSCFEFNYYDMGTSEGLVRFSQCEILNPQRIPSFMVLRSEGGSLLPVPHRIKISRDDESLDTWLALETDYRAGGVIKPAAIREILDTALQSLTVKA